MLWLLGGGGGIRRVRAEVVVARIDPAIAAAFIAGLVILTAYAVSGPAVASKVSATVAGCAFLEIFAHFPIPCLSWLLGGGVGVAHRLNPPMSKSA